MNEDPLARVRALCLGLPETEERLSHGEPTFFVQGKRVFVMYANHHHNDGRLGLWCNAPPGVQRELIEKDSRRFFVPPYVGYRGWIGVRLDVDPDWEEIAGIIERAYLVTAPKRLRDRIGHE
ncbi:MAG: MmcQ/YjbR family DNA-binding protein [Dehalococcoidia bacterium]